MDAALLELRIPLFYVICYDPSMCHYRRLPPFGQKLKK